MELFVVLNGTIKNPDSQKPKRLKHFRDNLAHYEDKNLEQKLFGQLQLKTQIVNCSILTLYKFP